MRGSVGASKRPTCRVITALASAGLLVSSACGSSGASLDKIVRPTDDERAGSTVAAMVTRSNGSRAVGL